MSNPQRPENSSLKPPNSLVCHSTKSQRQHYMQPLRLILAGFDFLQPLRQQSALMELGASPHELFNLLYEQKSLARIHLAGRVLSRMETACDGRLAWVFAKSQDLKETNAVPADTESLVNECLTISGSEAAFIAVQLPSGQIKFSLRCRSPHNVAALAEIFNGGGHKLASGATLPGPLDEALVKVRDEFVKMLMVACHEPLAVSCRMR